MALRRAYAQPMAGLYASARIRKVLGTASLSITAADVTTAGNQVAAFICPSGFTVTGINATVPTLDGGATLTISIGDASNNARLVSASTVGRSPGGSITTLAAGAAYFTFPIDTEVLLTFPAQAATPTAGAITNFYIEGYVQNP